MSQELASIIAALFIAAALNLHAADESAKLAALPRVLIIGDSISIGYTPVVKNLLKGQAEVIHSGNAADTRYGLKNLDIWLGNGLWDCIHFNWGLWDLKGGAIKACVVPEEEYAANLKVLAGRMKQTGAKVIWASTTPVPKKNGMNRAEKDVVSYNERAKALMAELGVAVNDLHAVVLPQLDTLQQPGDVHFKSQGSEVLGQAVAAAIAGALGLAGIPEVSTGPTRATRPILLCLGDSNGAGWIPALQTLVKADLINASQGGMTIGFDNLGSENLNMLKRIDSYFEKEVAKPQRVIREVVILLGTNDGKAVFADRQEEVVPNLERLIVKLRAFAWPEGHVPGITLVTPPPYGAVGDDTAAGKYAGAGQRIAALVPKFAALGEKVNAKVIDIYTPLNDRFSALTTDGLHFNPAGNAEVARLIAAGLDPELRVTVPPTTEPVIRQ